MYENNIFDIEPSSEIIFKYYSLSNIFGDLKIKNASEGKILFRIKCENLNEYVIIPVFGNLEKGEMRSIKFLMKTPKNRLNERIDDVFIIEAIKLDGDRTNVSNKEEAQHAKQQNKVSVVLHNLSSNILIKKESFLKKDKTNKILEETPSLTNISRVSNKTNKANLSCGIKPYDLLPFYEEKKEENFDKIELSTSQKFPVEEFKIHEENKENIEEKLKVSFALPKQEKREVAISSNDKIEVKIFKEKKLKNLKQTPVDQERNDVQKSFNFDDDKVLRRTTSRFGGNLGNILENIEIDTRELEKPPPIPPLLLFQTAVENLDQDETKKATDNITTPTRRKSIVQSKTVSFVDESPFSKKKPPLMMKSASIYNFGLRDKESKIIHEFDSDFSAEIGAQYKKEIPLLEKRYEELKSEIKKTKVFNEEKQDELKKMNFLHLFLHPKDSPKDKERRSRKLCFNGAITILFLAFLVGILLSYFQNDLLKL